MRIATETPNPPDWAIRVIVKQIATLSEKQAWLCSHISGAGQQGKDINWPCLARPIATLLLRQREMRNV